MQPIKRRIYIGLALLVFAVTLLASSAIALAAPTFNRPIDNSTHVANAIALSKAAYSGGASAAVITSGDTYTDSLTAAVLAKAYSGPLLLSAATKLSADVASELTRLHPSKVFIVGLPSSFAAGVKAAVSGLTDQNIVVLKGADRYGTAALVAAAVRAKMGTVSKVVIAPGDSYGAALAASSLAAAQGWPLLLMPAAGPLPQSAKDVIADLGVSSGIVVGTNATLGVSGFTVTKRIVGTTSNSDSDGRYDAAAKLADYAASQGWLSYAHIGIVSGEDYPDGEATVAYMAKDKGVLLFSKSSALEASTSATLKAHGTAVKKTDIVGLGWAVYREVKGLNSARVTALDTRHGPTAGGNKLVVTGMSLDKATKVRVGKVDVPSGSWKADSSTQLTISSVPAAYGDGPVEVTVFNYWGASPATTKDLYWYGSDGAPTPGEKVVQKAVEYLGVPYLWAGASPTGGFDCSGFCLYVYKQFGVSLPHYSRSMSTYGTAVAKADLQPGDLIFFYTPISHVGMYVGGGLMINAPRSGDLVCIEDAYRSGYVTARRMITSPYTRYEQTESRLAFGGTWSTTSTASASGGSFAYANAQGSSVTISFNGTHLDLFAKKSSVYGIAKVTLDKGAASMVDLYSAATAWQQKIWTSGTVASGNHTVTIEWTGTKNASSTDTNIGIDALELKGSLTQASATPVTPNPVAVRYEQTDSRIAYAGTWTAYSGAGPSAGSYARTCAANSSATVAFNGTYLAWIGTKGTTLGKAKVSLDGRAVTTVDLSATAVSYQKKLWETGTLASGAHTVTITWDSGNAAGMNVGLDAVDVIGTLTKATATPPGPTTVIPATTRYEQKDARFTFAGGWIATSSDQASATSFRFANSKAYATATFNGTYLAWIGKKSPDYGVAKVSIDGGSPTNIDLYSSGTSWQQKVWDTGVLPAGNHTVRIEWTGVTNPNGLDANINVDAFEIAGAVTQAPAAAPIRYEQSDTHIAYAGSWTSTNTSAASAGNFRYSNTKGSSVTVTFVGSYLAWIAKQSPVYGKAKVTLDGGTPVVVDLYAAREVFKQKVWETGNLVPGTHTLTIEWTGTKSSAATDTNIGVDALDIVGTLK